MDLEDMGDYIESSSPTTVGYLLKKISIAKKILYFLDIQRSTKGDGYSINT
jgi:hypothetical protein